MILTTIENLENYTSLHRYYKVIADFFKNNEISLLPAGRTDILEDNELYVIHVLEGECRSKSEALLEAHRLYIDVQVVLEGNETMAWKPLQDCQTVEKVYDPENDIIFYSDEADTYLDLKGGQVAIFAPNDGHAPLIGSGKIHKLIFKARV